jgi:hypothetical protein
MKEEEGAWGKGVVWDDGDGSGGEEMVKGGGVIGRMMVGRGYIFLIAH